MSTHKKYVLLAVLLVILFISIAFKVWGVLG